MSVDSSKEVVKLLHILGYGSKQTAYWLWKWGYKGISLQTIQAYIRINRRHWAKDKEKFMSEIVELKEKLFQSAKEEVMAAERATMEILLRNIKKLQESLESLDPVKDKAEFNTTYNQLIKLEERCKSYHGLEEFRSASIKASTEIAVYKEKAKVDANPNPQIKDAIETKAELMD
jgi:DNA-binding transcriptional MerR regulator